MATFQGALIDATARIKGAGIMYVKSYVSADAVALAGGGGDSYSWQSVGSVTGIHPKEDMVATDLKGDNAYEEKYVSEQKITVAVNQREPCLEVVRSIIRGTFDTKVTTAGSLVSGAAQVIASGAGAYGTVVTIEHQNGSGAAITVNSVTGGTDGLLTVDVDYTITKDGLGRYGIALIAGLKISTLSQTFTIDYDYTPTASIDLYMGGKTSLPYFSWKIVNTDENSKLISIYGWKATIDQGFDFQYKADDAADPVAENPLQFTSIIDTNVATLGKQLGKIYQERGI